MKNYSWHCSRSQDSNPRTARRDRMNACSGLCTIYKLKPKNPSFLTVYRIFYSNAIFSLFRSMALMNVKSFTPMPCLVFLVSCNFNVFFTNSSQCACLMFQIRNSCRDNQLYLTPACKTFFHLPFLDLGSPHTGDADHG